MSAYEIRDAIVPELEKGEVDFVCLNFANGDMVGHTGVFEAAVKACETVDHCSKEVINTGLKNGYTTLLIADHGNCEIMINPDVKSVYFLISYQDFLIPNRDLLISCQDFLVSCHSHRANSSADPGLAEKGAHGLATMGPRISSVARQQISASQPLSP